MKFTCELKALRDAINNVSLAVSPRSNLQALEGILLQCTGPELTLTGYNLELGIIKKIAVTGTEDGTIILNARIFGDIIRKMPSDQVIIETDDKYLTVIRGGDTEFTILGTSAEEFPEIPTVQDGSGFSMPQYLLKNMISQTLFAIAQNENSPVLTGSLFDVSEGLLQVVSVDGYRLALRKEPISCDETFSFVVPGKTLHEVIKLLSEEEEDAVSLQVNRKHIIFSVSGYHIVSRLLEGEFLDYKAAISGNVTTTVRIDTREFIQSLERASIIINDRIKSPITAKMENNSIAVRCMTSLGKVSDLLPAQIDGDNVTIGFNNKYMLDALKATGTDEVNMRLDGPFAPMRIFPLEGDSFIFLVLPVRLKGE